MMELTEDFIKILQIIIAIIGALAIFLIFVNYNIIVNFNEAERNALLLGDALLGSKCLADIDLNGNAIKGLFLEEKLNSIAIDKSCLSSKYKFGKITVEADETWEIELGEDKKTVKTTLAVAVKKTTGEVVMGEVKIEL